MLLYESRRDLFIHRVYRKQVSGTPKELIRQSLRTAFPPDALFHPGNFPGTIAMTNAQSNSAISRIQQPYL